MTERREPFFTPPASELSRIEINGFVYGAWWSGKAEESPEDELHLRGKDYTIDIATHYGGPESKYQRKNEDVFLALTSENRFFIVVADGAGGSGNGRRAAQLTTESLYEMERCPPRKELEHMIDATNHFVGEEAEGGFATTALIRSERVGDTWNIEAAGFGDCKVMTVRNGEKWPGGTTNLQNMAAIQTQLQGQPQDYYNHPLQSGATGGFGLDRRTRLVDRPQIIRFRGEKNDQIILACDGFWDIVSEYEVALLATIYRGKKLQAKLFQLAYLRNNALQPFTIQHSEAIAVTKSMKVFREADQTWKSIADNLTIAVIDLGEDEF